MITLKEYAMSFVGVPYRWGGDDPISGFDCSGFVGEILKSAGLMGTKERLTAQGIYDKLELVSSHTPMGLGTLVFFGESVTKITHVAFMIDQYRMIEAASGDSSTLDDGTASKQNAFIKIRLLTHRKDFVGSLKPNYATIGMI